MKNKILTILCIFIIFSVLFINNNIFATNNWQSPYDIQDMDFTYKEYFIADACISRNISSFARYLVVIASNSESALDNTTFYTNNTSQHRLSSIVVGSETVHLFVYKLQSDNTWGDGSYKTLNPGADHEVLYGNLSGDYQVFTYIAASKDIIYYPDKSVFFQQTPVTGTLAPILGEVEMVETTMREILILVPIMIVLIASYLGLRKGLALLKTLRKM